MSYGLAKNVFPAKYQLRQRDPTGFVEITKITQTQAQETITEHFYLARHIRCVCGCQFFWLARVTFKGLPNTETYGFVCRRCKSPPTLEQRNSFHDYARRIAGDAQQ